jgi:hypothetical protein
VHYSIHGQCHATNRTRPCPCLLKLVLLPTHLLCMSCKILAPFICHKNHMKGHKCSSEHLPVEASAHNRFLAALVGRPVVAVFCGHWHMRHGLVSLLNVSKAAAAAAAAVEPGKVNGHGANTQDGIHTASVGPAKSSVGAKSESGTEPLGGPGTGTGRLDAAVPGIGLAQAPEGLFNTSVRGANGEGADSSSATGAPLAHGSVSGVGFGTGASTGSANKANEAARGKAVPSNSSDEGSGAWWWWWPRPSDREGVAAMAQAQQVAWRRHGLALRTGELPHNHVLPVFRCGERGMKAEFKRARQDGGGECALHVARLGRVGRSTTFACTKHDTPGLLPCTPGSLIL